MNTTHIEVGSLEGVGSSGIPPKVASAKTSKKLAIDLSKYRSPERDQTDLVSTGNFSQSQYPVIKPGTKNFFRANPDEAYAMYGVPVMEDDERNIHLIHPDFEDDVPEDVQRFVQNVNLVLCVNHKRGVFVWYFKNTTSDWSKSAMSVIRKARSEWVRIRANTAISCYETEKAPPELAVVEPKWPDLSFEEILNLAFDGRTIHSADNPVIRGYQGKV